MLIAVYSIEKFHIFVHFLCRILQTQIEPEPEVSFNFTCTSERDGAQQLQCVLCTFLFQTLKLSEHYMFFNVRRYTLLCMYKGVI